MCAKFEQHTRIKLVETTKQTGCSVVFLNKMAKKKEQTTKKDRKDKQITTMKISIIVSLLLLGHQDQPFALDTRFVDESFLDKHNIEPASSFSSTFRISTKLKRDTVLVDSNLVSHIQALTGYKFSSHMYEYPLLPNDDAELNDGVSFPVQITTLTSTSRPHVDHFQANRHNKRRRRVKPDERVAFVMLNSNEKAHFDHHGEEYDRDGDGGMCVPVVKGKVVHFDGSVPHNTIVNSGFVQLLGPFHASSMTSVGDDCLCDFICPRPARRIPDQLCYTVSTNANAILEK